MSDPLNRTALQALRETTGDDPEFLAELVRTFLEDSPGQLDELRSAAATGNADDLRRGAHTLKANALTFGIDTLADVCRELEGRASEGSLDNAEELVAAIGEALAGARPALEALADGDGTA
jgi:HPt (histidine-containing phosphotransfer) domain-containing protein